MERNNHTENEDISDKYLNEYIDSKYSDIKHELDTNKIELIKNSVGFNSFILRKCHYELLDIIKKKSIKFTNYFGWK